ncbi:MAG: UDP-N-acetylmuramoyl-tripeptide--D-alanyl-D-alanine ligase [Alistipes sp.]|nr:UDP-N-acetylmuramoyl-tripeptide--D-alanyl-D-alanine ligase [Alistipes sp.]
MTANELLEIYLRHPRVSTDSRRIEPDSIFFALHGTSFDGNRFACEALAKGAARAVVDDPSLAAAHPEAADRLILVEDTLVALQELARAYRRRLGIPILAITGSNGKTTTKELVSRVLAEKYAVYATRGNLNNHIGVPLTLLAMGSRTQFGVVEMGASACGEIALLCSIAEPDCGIITNVGRAHLEGFGGPEGIRRGKGELFDSLNARGGRAFVRLEDTTLLAMAQERPALAATRYPTASADGMEHRLEGDYNRFNVAAAAAIGRHFGIDEESIRRAIASYRPDNHRSQRVATGRNTLILDCYNANPSSMEASIRNFAAEPTHPHKEKVLILGDMLELGRWSEEEHRRIIALAASTAGARLLLVGPHFAAVCADTSPRPARTELFASREELARALAQNPIRDALILIKGSHGIGLEQLTGLL